MDPGPGSSVRAVARGPRPAARAFDVRAVSLPPLPAAHERGDHAGYLVGALGSFGLVGVMVVGAHGRQLVVALAAAVLSIGGVALAALLGSRRTRTRAARRRRRWTELAGLRIAEVDAAAVAQRSALDAVHPRDVRALRALAHGGPGLWQRRLGDLDRLSLGVGRAPCPARVTVSPDVLDSGLDSPDGACVQLARAALERTAVVPDCAVTVDLLRGGLAIVGPITAGRALARWLVTEAAVARPPHELAVGVVTGDRRDDGEWAWLRWLPHAHDPAVPDGTATSIAATVHEVDGLLRGAAAEQLVIVDGAVHQSDPLLTGPSGPVARGFVHVLGDEAALVGTVAHRIDLRDCMLRTAAGDEIFLDVVSALTREEATEMARGIAPLRAADRPVRTVSGAAAGLGLLLGDASPTVFDPERVWRERPESDLLRIPLGTDELGPKWLDLRESAAGGMGPHGLVVGATGTGKSEVLRTLVTGLVARHSPAELALLLVDFKGGAAFDPFAGLPQVAGLVTNLAGDEALIIRMCQALEGELADRQEGLRQAGIDSVGALRRAGGACPPALVVVVDEFSELLAACPDALDVLLRVGRLGRSLGIHLVLATQRWEEGRLRGLEAHVRWRLCLRTFTMAESMAVLGTPAAATLPAEPGAALLAVDGVPSRVQVAYSGAAAGSGAQSVPVVRPLRLRPPVNPGQSTSAADGDATVSVRDAVVRAIGATSASRTPAIWLPPLGSRIGPVPAGAVGLVDRPRLRRQVPLTIDALASGPVAVVGAPGSGVSGVLSVLAACSSRADLGIVVLACGGTGLGELAKDPAVLAWADAGDPDHAVAVLDAVLAAALGSPGSALPDAVLLVVDGLARARDVVEDLDLRLTRIASAAGSGTVGLIVGAQRWGDLRGGLRDLVPSRFELRLADPADSLHGRPAAAALFSAPPGRGLSTTGEQVQFAHPEDRVACRPPAAVRHRIEPLPAFAADSRAGFAIRAGDLAPVEWGPADGHLIVLGDRASGRSTALRRMVTNRARGRTLVVDPRRSLGDVATRRDVHWTTDDDAVAELASLAAACAAGEQNDLLVVIDDADLLPAAVSGALLDFAAHLRRAEDLGVGLVLARPVTGWLRASYDPVLQALRDSSPTVLLLAGDPAEGPVVGAVRARRDVPGRGRLIGRRGEVTHVQVMGGEVTHVQVMGGEVTHVQVMGGEVTHVQVMGGEVAHVRELSGDRSPPRLWRTGAA